MSNEKTNMEESEQIAEEIRKAMEEESFQPGDSEDDDDFQSVATKRIDVISVRKKLNEETGVVSRDTSKESKAGSGASEQPLANKAARDVTTPATDATAEKTASQNQAGQSAPKDRPSVVEAARKNSAATDPKAPMRKAPRRTNSVPHHKPAPIPEGPKTVYHAPKVAAPTRRSVHSQPKFQVEDVSNEKINEDVTRYLEKRRYEKEKAKKKKKQRVLIGILIGILILLGLVAVWKMNDFTITMSIPDGQVEEIPYGEAYDLPEVTARFHGKIFWKNGVGVHVTDNGKIDTSKVGSYTETFKASWLGVKSEIHRTVKIVDNKKPIIDLRGDLKIILEQGQTYLEPGYTATDEWDGDLTVRVLVDNPVDVNVPGRYTVKYSVKDSSGNEMVCERLVVVRDTDPPAIQLTGDREMRVKVGGTWEEPGVKAIDAIEGEVDVTIQGEVDMTKPGTYEIAYLAEDSFGNKASAVRTVYVVKETPKAEEPGHKVVYLTFDDGPGPYTEDLLKILDRYDAKATFYVTNQYPKYRDMIKKEYKAGHTVAIHTYTHNYGKIYASRDAFWDDIKKMSDICEEATGKAPILLRFPGGASNTISKNYCEGIMTDLVKDCDAKGYLYCDWNVDSNDAGGAASAEEVAANVIAGIEGKDISYVLQHDVKGFSVEAVEQILKWGKENGYSFQALTEKSPMNHHTVNN